MNLWLRWKFLFVCIGIIILAFVAISIMDVVIAAVNLRFYSNATFIVTFGVGGVFAACVGYISSIEHAPVKNEASRWSLIILMILSGMLFFFLLSELEGGEYRVPFKAFGLMLALGSLLFVKGKID